VVTVTREFAERIAAMADLLLTEENADAPLSQLADFALELIPGSAAAGVVVGGEHAWTYATSDSAIAELHQAQLDSGAGPVPEALRFGEARRIDDAKEEDRWSEVCAAMTEEGLRSCLILPLRTDRDSRGAIALYSAECGAFSGAGHDVALLFAAQGGVAMRNATLYRKCQGMITNLHVALESRAVIEQAKGILVAEYGYSPDVAFKRLSVASQNGNRKLRELAADLVAGRIQRHQFGDS
jgi:GAF domain-containing protein